MHTFFSGKVDLNRVGTILMILLMVVFFGYQHSFFDGLQQKKAEYSMEGQFFSEKRDSLQRELPGNGKPEDILIFDSLRTVGVFAKTQDYKVRAVLERLCRRAELVGYPVLDYVSKNVSRSKAARADYMYNPQEARYEAYIWTRAQDVSSRKIAIAIDDGLGLNRVNGKRTLRITKYDGSSFFLRPETEVFWQRLAYTVGAREITVTVF